MAGRRTMAERRKLNVKKAIRKRKIAKEVYWSQPNDDWEYYDNLHQYSKNKIHCSCPMCSAKTRNKKVKPAFNPKISDRRKIEAGNQQIEEAGLVENS